MYLLLPPYGSADVAFLSFHARSADMLGADVSRVDPPPPPPFFSLLDKGLRSTPPYLE